jgi:hypothetical protein
MDCEILASMATQRVLEKRGGDSDEVAPEDLIAAANELNGEIKIVNELDDSLLGELARESGALICPTSAALGDIVGHDVLKAMSEGLTPLTQFIAVGSVEALPPQPIEFIPQNDRCEAYWHLCRCLFHFPFESQISNCREGEAVPEVYRRLPVLEWIQRLQPALFWKMDLSH